MTTPDILTLDYHGQRLRVVIKDGEPWYVAADLCRILSVYLTNGRPAPKDGLKRLRPGDKALHPIGPRLVSIINRDGLADFAFWGKRPGAPELFVWADEALPLSTAPAAAA